MQYLDKNGLSHNEVLSFSVQHISKETCTDVAALISKTSIANFVTTTSQTSLNMSFSVYTAEYLGAPNHRAIYIKPTPLPRERLKEDVSITSLEIYFKV